MEQTTRTTLTISCCVIFYLFMIGVTIAFIRPGMVKKCESKSASAAEKCVQIHSDTSIGAAIIWPIILPIALGYEMMEKEMDK